ETFKEAGLEQSALVIFSDGEALEGMEQVDAIRDEANAVGMSILAVGVGSVEGAIIPEVDENGVPVPGLFVKDDQGQVVRTRLVADALQSLSSGGGAYVSLSGHTSLTQAVEQITQGLASTREESETRLRPIERFMWPLGAAAALLVLAHLLPLFWLKPSPPPNPSSAPVRRLAAGVTVFLGTLLFPTGSALARDSIRHGYEAYQEDNFAGAIEAYEGALTERLTAADRTRLHMGIGAAAYRLGDYERAAEAYGRALVEGNETRRSQTHYNLGNTLFRQGETALRSSSDPDQPQRLTGPGAAEDTIRDWEASIEHFETTLSLEPGNPRAAHNLELVKQRLEDLKKQLEEEQKKEEEEQKKEEESKDEPEEKDEQEEQDQEEGKQDEGENKDEGKKEGEQEQKDSQEKGQNPPEDKDGDGQPDDPQEKPGKENPQNPGDGEPKNDPSSQEPQDGDGEKPDPENAPDKNNPGEGQPDKENTPQNPGQNPPAPPDAPQDGKLEADPNQAQPKNQESSGQPGQAEAAAGQQINPATGYSPSEARQLLEALADETEVRPFVQPSRGETYKNW
ncbi:MAG: tetratricopeptide repeat protein, partial [Verrucomicrobiaceae bacterium]|nr:tetratricopeptide repeat protein [Verrucomicrobiaceae bacterium]